MLWLFPTAQRSPPTVDSEPAGHRRSIAEQAAHQPSERNCDAHGPPYSVQRQEAGPLVQKRQLRRQRQLLVAQHGALHRLPEADVHTVRNH